MLYEVITDDDGGGARGPWGPARGQDQNESNQRVVLQNVAVPEERVREADEKQDRQPAREVPGEIRAAPRRAFELDCEADAEEQRVV